jgi:hypothetical protein
MRCRQNDGVRDLSYRMSYTYAPTSDLIAYKITDMEPLRFDEAVSGSGEWSQLRCQAFLNAACR